MKMFNAQNDSALLAPTELSNDDLELVLGGDGPSGAQPSEPNTSVNIDFKPVSVDIHANVDFTQAVTTNAETAQHVVDAGIQAVQNSETAHAIDQLGAEIVNTVTEAVHGTAEFVGDVFNAIGDFFGGGYQG
jgi:hypothetical protein